MAYVVSIAGSDSSGGAGNQADVSCIDALGHHPLSVVTAITAQDTKGVHHVSCSDKATMQAQLSAVFSSFKVSAAKSGLLPSTTAIHTLESTLRTHSDTLPYVLDPVMFASTGARLSADNTVRAMVQHLVPLATVVTPNILEAEILTGRYITSLDEIIAAGKDILELGCRAVLIKGGHAKEDPGMDVLIDSRGENVPYYIHGKYFPDRSPRGTGCTYAAAIACGLASHLSLYDAILKAKRYITAAIANAYCVEPNFWRLNHRAAASEA